MDNYVYKDRKMMKWVPFNALLEQSDYIRNILEGRVRIEMPVLSVDQEAELNYKLETISIFNSQCIISYYEDGKIKTAEGNITKTDDYKKLIFVNNTKISARQITNIEVI